MAYVEGDVPDTALEEARLAQRRDRLVFDPLSAPDHGRGLFVWLVEHPGSNAPEALKPHSSVMEGKLLGRRRQRTEEIVPVAAGPIH